MKKVLVFCLVLAFALSFSVSAVAETGGFVSSPSRNQAPTLIEGANESNDCESKLFVTSYSDRTELSAEACQRLEVAYAAIIGAQDLSELTGDIEDIAKELNIQTSELSVVDMFDISSTDCGFHEGHGHFNITLKPETLKNFVCLLHYHNGEWTIVENAEVTNNGQNLEFFVDDFSPFAIVVSSLDINAAPAKTNTDWIAFSGVASGVVAIAAGAVYGVMLNIKRKKIVK